MKALLLMTVLAVPSIVVAQGRPGTNLSVEVEVASVDMHGDTVFVRYRLRNSSSSAERLRAFTVDAPTGVASIERPEPRDAWYPLTSYRGRPVATWSALGDALPPGATSPELSFSARGLPGVVTAWIRGNFPPPLLGDSTVVAPSTDPLTVNSMPLHTVGVVPAPPASSLSALGARLLALADTSCGNLHWITSVGICTSLRAKIDAAVHDLDRGQLAAAARTLRALLDELDAQNGQHVSRAAYWLLHANAAYLLGLVSTG